VAAVFTEAAKVCIVSEQEFEVFSWTYSAIKENPHNLPSWVLDWTRMDKNAKSKAPLIYNNYGFTITGSPGMDLVI